MAQVTVTLNGRTYRLECDDGEEQHLLTLAGEMSQRIEILKERFGQVGDDRLMLMAGLMLADELSEARQELEEATAALDRTRQRREEVDARADASRSKLAGRLSTAADRIEALNERLRPGDDGD